jgi:hypothetical protein
MFLLVSSAAHAAKGLSASERRSCSAQGGYESSSAFGLSICLVPYADAGRACSDKSGCTGRCLIDLGDEANKGLRPGDKGTGFCEAESYTPGCYAEVAQGKITTETCVD